MGRTVRSFSAELEPLIFVEKRPERYPAFHESGAAADAAAPDGRGEASSRFDILFITTGERLALDARGRVTGPTHGAATFLSALDAWWGQLRLPHGSGALPFQGGWLVYLGYETAGEIEPRLVLPPGHDPMMAAAIRAPAAWIRDRQGGRAWLVAESGHESLLDDFERDAARWQPAQAAGVGATDVAAAGSGAGGEVEPAVGVGVELDEEDPEHFLAAVRRALEYVAAGDIYQANLSRGWRCRTSESLSPVQLYRRLRAANPSPFAALWRDGDFAVVSSSPERLASIRGDTVATRPIAGTRPRSSDPAVDAALVRALFDSEKERAEHVMLIDLERNDLGRVCVGGSVVVDEYMTLESYAHVHHIVSNVVGRLRADATPVDVIRALFPGGTITGCPKVRCMEIIAKLEGVGRGAYTGSLGYLNRDGSCDFNILIRTITAQGRELRLRAGAGIVADSRPEQELAETRAKAKGLLRALDGLGGAAR